MRLSETGNAMAEREDPGSLGIQMQTFISAADEDDKPRPNDSNQAASNHRNGSSDSSGPATATVQEPRAESHGENPPHRKFQEDLDSSDEVSEPHLQPSPFADVPNSSQNWPTLPNIDHASQTSTRSLQRNDNCRKE